MKYIELRNGVKMPMLGYGTLQIKQSCVTQCVLEALENGYRLIDTAASYLNEEGIGKAIQRSHVPRKEIFLTTKVWVQDAGYEKTIQAFENSLKKLQTNYIDLYLIHQPYGDYYGSWRAMEELYQQGKIRAIGVCNFSAERLVDLCLNSHIQPMVNQIEIHPFFQQKELLEVMEKYQCLPQAWGPLNEGQRHIFTNLVLTNIASQYHKTVSQVILRWHYQKRLITIPKTIHPKRMKENINIWDFSLNEEDMKRIENMDLGYSEIINHQSYTTAKWLNKYKIHDEEEK